MPRYNLRNAPIDSHDAKPVDGDNPADDAVQADPVDDMCVVCQEPITDDQNVVTLRCCHRFHGQCLCDHLVHDGRCPICRDSPYADPFDYDYESEEEEPRSVTVKEAIQSARANRKNCKQTDRMLKTISKWRKERKEAGARVRALRKRLSSMENAIFQKVDEMEKKLFANLKRREATLYDSVDKSCKEISRAHANYSSAQQRVAQKYGYRRPPRLSSVRWIGSNAEEDEE